MNTSSLVKLSKPFKWTHEYLNYVLSESKSRIISSKNLQNAFLEIDRLDFLPPRLKDLAYDDTNVDIGWGEKLDKPTTIALMLELLDIKKGGRYLDIGTGSGYTAAIIASAAGKRGQVISLERKDFLVEIARINISKYPFIKNLSIHLADGRMGYKEQAPYDGIHVSASYEQIPEILKGQLNIGGKMIVPQGRDELMLITRESVTHYKQKLYKSFFFDKIKTDIS